MYPNDVSCHNVCFAVCITLKYGEMENNRGIMYFRVFSNESDLRGHLV